MARCLLFGRQEPPNISPYLHKRNGCCFNSRAFRRWSNAKLQAILLEIAFSRAQILNNRPSPHAQAQAQILGSADVASFPCSDRARFKFAYLICRPKFVVWCSDLKLRGLHFQGRLFLSKTDVAGLSTAAATSSESTTCLMRFANLGVRNSSTPCRCVLVSMSLENMKIR